MPTEEDSEIAESLRELKTLERDLSGQQHTPFIDRPEELDLKDGMTCWLNGTRVCGSDCVAFNPEELDEHGEMSNSPNQCLWLLYAGQQGAQAMASLSLRHRQMQELQDREREGRQGPPPPDPRGGAQ